MTDMEDIFTKELKDVSRIITSYGKTHEHVSHAMMETFRKWEQAIAVGAKALGVAQESTKRSEEQTKRIGLNTEAVIKETAAKKDARLVIIKQQRAMQDSYAADVDRHLRMRDSMKKTSNQFDFITQSLTKGRGLAATFGLLVQGGFNAAKASNELAKSLKRMDKANASGDPDAIKSATKDVKQAQENEKRATLDSKKLSKIAGSLSKAGAYFEKHATGIMIGAGAAGILIGIIIKALSIAPMFQAMMKLMQFAVTMILMPIGTFFGAMIKPMMIGLIKGIAPEFKKWMETSMTLGESVGKWMLAFFMGDVPTMITGVQDMVGAATEGDVPSIVGTAALVGIPVATAVAVKRIVGSFSLFGKGAKGLDSVASLGKQSQTVAKIITVLKGLTGIGAAGSIINTGRATGKFGTTVAGKAGNILTGGKLTTIATDKTIKAIEKILAKALPSAMKTGIKLGFKAIPIVGWATLIGDALGSVVKYVSEDTYEAIRKGVKSIFGDNDATEFGLDVLGFGKQSTAEWLYGGAQNLLGTTPDAQAQEDIADSGENAVSDAEIFEHAIYVMAREDAPKISTEMAEMLNHFVKMKGEAKSSYIAATETASMFSLAYKTVRAKMESWIKSIPPEKKGTKKNANAVLKSWVTTDSVAAWNEVVSESGATGWGEVASGFVENGMFNGGKFNSLEGERLSEIIKTTPIQKKLEAEAARAQAQLDARYDPYKGYREDEGFGSASEYLNEDSTAVSKHRFPEGFDSTGMTRAQMEKSLERAANPIPLLSTGGIDWVTRLASNTSNTSSSFADGGWIREPVIGVGRNTGKTYSIGERGAEYVSPNGSKGGTTININIAKIEKDADFTKLKPMIQRWILEANSRRGMI